MNKNIVSKFFFIPGQLKQWKKFNYKKYEIWIACINKEKQYEKIKSYLNLNLFNQYKDNFINKLGNHFGLVIYNKSFILAATDLSRSYPIYWKKKNNSLYLSPQAQLLQDKDEEVSYDQLLAFRMSSYTTDNKTIWKNISNIRSASYLFLNKNSEPTIKRYYLFQPWKIENKNYLLYRNNLKKEINKLLLNIIEKAAGRTLIIPLSAGLDSRLIVSGLKEKKYKNVKCFTYGLKNNFESRIAIKIAKKLQYKIQFVEINRKKAREFFESSDFSDYLKLTNDGISTPTIGGLYAVHFLLKSKFISRNDILINGNSGDFISGGHIPLNIKDISKPSKNIKLLFNKVFDAHFSKHYSLWDILYNKKNRIVIKNILYKQIRDNVPKGKKNYGHSLLEFLEFENRQTKHVVNCQRVYDYYKLDWLLPLWNKSFIKFWQTVPLKYKLNQLLYKEVLNELNYGGVWNKEYFIKPYITPIWIRVLRSIIKSFFIVFGKNKWHRFERRYLNYWTNIICDLCINSYLNTIKNKNGFRHAVSFLSLKIEKMNLGKPWK